MENKYEIDINSLLDFKAKCKAIYASQYGNGINKEIGVTGNGNFIVISNNEIIEETSLAQIAVDKYNSI